MTGLVRLVRMSADSGTQENITEINKYAISTDDVSNSIESSKYISIIASALTSNTTIDNTYKFKSIELDSSGGSFTITLDSTSKAAGWWCEFKDVAGACAQYPITIVGGGDNIDEATSFIINGDWNYLKLEWNGSQYLIKKYNENGLNTQDGVLKWRRNFALGSGSNDKYFKIATITINTQYQGCIASGKLILTDGTADNAIQSDFLVRFKQQDTMTPGHPPVRSLHVKDSGAYYSTYPYTRAIISQDDGSYKILDIYAYSPADYATLYLRLEANNNIISPVNSTPSGVSEATMLASGTEIDNKSYINQTTDYSSADYLISPNPLYIDNDLLFASDETYDIGSGSNKPADIYTLNAVTVTSDDRKKNIIDKIDTIEKKQVIMEFIDSLTVNTVTYKNSRNPGNERLHNVLMVSNIKASAVKLGLSLDKFGAYIKKAFIRKEIKKDEAGNIIYNNKELSAINKAGEIEKKVIKEPIFENIPDYFEGLRYDEIFINIIPYIQELHRRIKELENK